MFPRKSGRWRHIKGFAEGFKSGLISPKANVQFHSSKKRDPFVTGAEDGRKQALSQPEEGPKRVTLLDLGYTETTETGLVRLEFEQCEFRPLGKKETWWFSSLTDLRELSDAIRKEKEASRDKQIQKGPDHGRVVATMTGFLSPKKKIGGYGHFGIYKREFVVTKIKELKPSKDKGS